MNNLQQAIAYNHDNIQNKEMSKTESYKHESGLKN